MIVTELRSSNIVLVIFLFIIPKNLVDTAAGRCYLCSQNTLAECAGNIQADSLLFHTVLQYYTEPCNGQCVLFRSDPMSTVRGCSWTYGHMTAKSTGWHELSPGIRAYFCDDYLCNNGTFERPDIPVIGTGIINSGVLPLPLPLPPPTLSPQQLFILSGNTRPVIQRDSEFPIINEIARQLRQCYVCTARSTGCGEYLDPRYASRYIQPCASSCILFRNPNDHHLITRDCSTSWPEVHAKSGLHKLLDSDAFFCQESLCNGVNFDFIMGIFHNKLPAVITFPPTPMIDDIPNNVLNPTMPIATTTTPPLITTTIPIEDDSVIWEDPDLDFVVVEPTPTTPAIPIPIPSTSTAPLLPAFPSTEIVDETDDEYELATETAESLEHFEFIENIPASSTISGGIANAEQESPLNWWDVNESSFPLVTDSVNSSLTTTPPLIGLEEDDWTMFNTTTVPPNIPSEHVSDLNTEVDLDMNDYFLLTLSTTPPIPSVHNQSLPLVPFFFADQKNKEHLFDFMKPMSTLAIPPFAWMLQLASQNRSKPIGRQNVPTRNFTTKIKKKRIDLQRTSNNTERDQFYEYCHQKQCQHGGRLNSDCLCICLPAFSGHHCEKIHCDQEPAHICDFVLEHECKTDYLRYLCPKFCQMNICSSKKPS